MNILLSTAFAATIAAVSFAAPASAAPASVAAAVKSGTTIETNAELVQEVRRRPGRWGHRGHWGYGAGGFVAGALVGAALANQAQAAPAPVYGDWHAYCASKYRSYDPYSGTFVGYDGRRHPCR